MSSPKSDQSTALPGDEPSGDRTGWKSWLIAVVVTAVVVAAGVLVIGGRGSSDGAALVANDQAQGPGGQGRRGGFPGAGARGEVTAIDGLRLTVRATDAQGATSTVVVETSEATEVTESVAGEVSDLSAGDTVVVMGEDTSGVVTATSISVGGGMFGGGQIGGQRRPGAAPSGAPQPPPDGRRAGGFTAGEVVSIEGSTVTITGQNGERVIVKTTSATTIRVTKQRSVGDIEVGDTILASGETADSVVKATTILIGDLGSPGRGFRGVPPGRPAPSASTGS